MLLTSAWTQLRPHYIQSQLWRSEDKLVAVRAGRRSGKTTIAKRRLVKQACSATLHGETWRGLYLAPVREQAKRIAWSDFKKLFHPALLDGPPSETELIIRTIYGSELHIGGFDKATRYEGSPWDFVVVDESADIKPKAVDLSIRPALLDRNGTLWRIGIPKRSGIGAAEWKQVCEDRSLGYTFFTWSAEEILDAEQLKQFADTYDAKDYREQIRAEAVEAGGLAYYNFADENIHANLHLTKYDPSRTIVVGSDFNVNPMAWILAHVHNSGVYVFDEIWLRDTNTRRTLDELYRRYSQHRAGWLFIGDAAGKGRSTTATSAAMSDYLIIKQDRRFSDGVEVRVKYPAKNPRIKDRLASVNAKLCAANGTRRLFVSPTCVNLIRDLSSQPLDEQGDPVKGGDLGHIADALGYVVHGLFPISHETDYVPAREKSAVEFLSIVS